MWWFSASGRGLAEPLPAQKKQKVFRKGKVQEKILDVGCGIPRAGVVPAERCELPGENVRHRSLPGGEVPVPGLPGNARLLADPRDGDLGEVLLLQEQKERLCDGRPRLLLLNAPRLLRLCHATEPPLCMTYPGALVLRLLPVSTVE